MKQIMKGPIALTCTQTLEDAPEIIRLIPLGKVSSRKGDFVADEESFAEICKYAKGRGIDIVIDYEHQTLMDVQAPAAGWIKELTLTEDAICGRVEWTPKAAEYLKNKEYRYLSPVIVVRPSNSKVIRLLSVALTNVPAIDGMLPIANKTDIEEGEENMDFTEYLAQLAVLLGLPEGATGEDVSGAVKKLAEECKTLRDGQMQPVANKTILSLLTLKDGATTADVTAKIVSLQNQVSQLDGKISEQECAGLVEKALKEGKITPAQKDWATQYALTDKAGFQEFAAKAAPVVQFRQIAMSAKMTKPENEFDKNVNEKLNLSPEDVAKYGKEDV